jgi:hypothetical protein
MSRGKSEPSATAQPQSRNDSRIADVRITERGNNDCNGSGGRAALFAAGRLRNGAGK